MSCSLGFGFCSSRALDDIRKPGVQIPHCSAASSRNACFSGCSLSAVARPSTVVRSAPVTSAARTQQELTRRPSMITAQAPQLPLLQPSLAPVRNRRSRSASRRLSRSSARNCCSSPLMVALTIIRSLKVFLVISRSLVARVRRAAQSAVRGFAQGALYQYGAEVLALLNAATHVIDRSRGVLGSLAGSLD